MPDYHLAWIEMGAFIRSAAESGRRLDAAEVLKEMQDIHEQYGLPPENAPKRAPNDECTCGAVPVRTDRRVGLDGWEYEITHTAECPVSAQLRNEI